MDLRSRALYREPELMGVGLFVWVVAGIGLDSENSSLPQDVEQLLSCGDVIIGIGCYYYSMIIRNATITV